MDIKDAGPRLRQMNDALAETERLRLTDAEREAVEMAIDSMNGVEDISASWSQRETAAIDTLRGLLSRHFQVPGNLPTQDNTPPAWMARPFYVDPAEGWAYGFPRLYDPAKDGDMTEWMVANGYPQRLADQNLPITFTAQIEQ